MAVPISDGLRDVVRELVKATKAVIDDTELGNLPAPVSAVGDPLLCAMLDAARDVNLKLIYESAGSPRAATVKRCCDRAIDALGKLSGGDGDGRRFCIFHMCARHDTAGCRQHHLLLARLQHQPSATNVDDWCQFFSTQLHHQCDVEEAKTAASLPQPKRSSRKRVSARGHAGPGPSAWAGPVMPPPPPPREPFHFVSPFVVAPTWSHAPPMGQDGPEAGPADVSACQTLEELEELEARRSLVMAMRRRNDRLAKEGGYY